MTNYNHEQAKILCPMAAAEVERLEGDLQAAMEQIETLRRVIATAAEIMGDACDS